MTTVAARTMREREGEKTTTPAPCLQADARRVVRGSGIRGATARPRRGDDDTTKNDDDQARGEEKGRRRRRHTTPTQPHEQLLVGWIAGGTMMWRGWGQGTTTKGRETGRR
jgi:hypothetical protein